MRIVVMAAVLLVACVDPVATCEERVCSIVPRCSPVTTAGWDLRSEEACLETFACGATPSACLEAVRALPCLSSPPSWTEIEASTRAFVRVREACGVD